MSLLPARCCCQLLRNRSKHFSRTLGSAVVLRQSTEAAANTAGRSHEEPDGGKIIIPKRIQREPTDILKAMASTVKKDFNSPAYRYIDDPETIPASTTAKKAYALAKASGRRAAQFVIKRYPKNFLNDPSDPSIEAFMPPLGPVLDPDIEDGLLERIDLRLVQESYESYKKNVEAGTALSDDTVQELLDLLCVYNSEEPEDHLLPEEQVFGKLVAPDNAAERIKNTWKDNGAAEELFNSITEPSERAYCSLIRGRAKFHQVDKAYQLFKEIKAKGMKPDVQTYNAVLSVISFVVNRIDERINLIKEELQSMREQDLHPSLDTFNNVLAGLSRSVRFNPVLVARFASSMINEMTACGVEPSLRTWFHMLRTFYFNDESQSSALHDIISRLEGKDLEVHHPEDSQFFSTAMVKCFVNLKDLELAYRIDDLLNYGQNYQAIGDDFREGLYCNFFMKTLCMFEQIDTIMAYYEKIVPNSFTPSFNALDDLFQALELNEGFEYLPKIWSDVYTFGYNRNLEIVEKVAALMAKRKQPEKVQGQYHKIICGRYDEAKTEVIVLEEKNELGRTELLRLVSAPLMSHMCQVCLDSDDSDQAREIFLFYAEYKNKIRGVFVEKAAVSLLQMFIKENDFDNAIAVLKTMADSAHMAIDVSADRVKHEMTLTDDQQRIVDDLL